MCEYYTAIDVTGVSDRNKGGWELPLWQQGFTHDILKCRSVWHRLDGPGSCCLIPPGTSLRHRYIFQSIFFLKIVWRQWLYLIFYRSEFNVLAVENMNVYLEGRKALQFGRYVPASWRNLLPAPLVSFSEASVFRLEGYVYRPHTDFVLFDTHIHFVIASLTLLVLWLLFIASTQHYNKECVMYISICGKQLTTECWLAPSTPDNGGTIFTITLGPR